MFSKFYGEEYEGGFGEVWGVKSYFWGKGGGEGVGIFIFLFLRIG